MDQWSPKSCGVIVVLIIMCVNRAQSSAADHLQHEAAAVKATVEEMPQRPMTLTNGYHPGLFPFNNGQPFIMDANTASFEDSNAKPNDAQQGSDDYYEYDNTKLEEVPYDYKGDPIDRKDVIDHNAPRPNDIVKSNNKVDKHTNPYHLFDLPKNYNLTDKFPLMSSSYANTKIQGSGGSSSSLSNHRMPQTSSSTLSSTPSTTSSWYNAVKSTTNTPRPTTSSTTTTTTTTTSTTTTTTTSPQEYEEYGDYSDYFHPQEPAVVSVPAVKVTTTTTANPSTNRHPSPIITPEPTTTMSTTRAPPPPPPVTTTTIPVRTENSDYDYNPVASVLNKTGAATTLRPEIDLKLDGTSFADYDTIKPVVDRERPEHIQSFKPLPGTYQFNDKTYPLITNSKVPMTFTAHVSSGLSLNQNREPADFKPPMPEASSEPIYSSRPSQPEIKKDSNKPQDGVSKTKLEAPIISQSESSIYSKPKPPKLSATDHGLETVYYKVKPDTLPGTNPIRPTNPPNQNRPYQTEPPALKTSQLDIIRKPMNSELQMSQGRPQPYPSDTYTKNKPPYTAPQIQSPQYTTPQNQPQYTTSLHQNQPQYTALLHQSQPQYTASLPQSQPQYTASLQQIQPQYTAPQSQPDTSKFKPPKHVINHFIKTQPNEDNKSYALQTSFSIGMDGERTDTRPAHGIGQVLLVEDSSSEMMENQTMPIKLKSTTSIPLISPSRPVQKPQPNYPRPQWETVPKPPPYYQASKRDGIPPPQRPNLPNILPQFRPNAKVDAPPMAPLQSHSATIERVQIPMDHLRPPPLPKPQFLKVDRNDENIDEEILDIPEKETRILQRTGPQPAKVTTLQMIQHGVPVKIRDDHKDNPVHVVYASNTPPKPIEKIIDDSVIDVKDRSDVPILKTKTTVNKPVKTDFPYAIVKPDENQNTSSIEYKAYSPTKPDTIKPNNDRELVPNIQDYVPVVTRDSLPSNVVIPQKPITATLKTSEDNHKTIDEVHKPLLQNFQIPFQPSLKLPENSNGWSVVRKPQNDNASERVDEVGDVGASTEKFDPENFKPQLVGGFMPINPPIEETKEKKTESERSKRSIKY